ncbi:MAG: hypothetical protein JRN46_03605 [Nitrososphaerota archaeon]|nr:hypothetical protein [Nitrososphaerota archaeon]
MKNQTFHRHRARIQESPELGLGQLRARTINALNNLGRQRFSAEPGGYALENWVRGVNVLLDEFEERTGEGGLSQDYRARRQELTDVVSRPVPLASIDEEISRLRTTISGIENEIGAERGRLAAKIAELKAERAECSGELDAEKARASEAAEAYKPDSFLSRLLGRKSSPADESAERIETLEARLATLSAEVLDQQRLLKDVDVRTPEGRFAGEWERLGTAQARLEALETERKERADLVKERAELTASIADAISRTPDLGARAA